MFRDVFNKMGLDVNKDLASLDGRNMKLEGALSVVKNALTEAGKDV